MLIPDIVRSYHAAYAALVQVAVFPSGVQDDGKPWGITDYPYLTDFGREGSLSFPPEGRASGLMNLAAQLLRPPRTDR
jgi:hypothetical protein